MVVVQPRQAHGTRILITDPIAQEGIDLLRYELPDADIDVRLDLSPERLMALIGDYTVLIVRSQTRVGEELLEKATNLQLIGRAGSGLDNIDLNAAIGHGVFVVHAPRGTAIAVSEHTMLLLLALARHLPAATSLMKAGRWDKNRLLGVELAGKVLGIIGLGRIGTEVARRAQAFGMRVLATPHLGASTLEAQVRVATEVARNIIAALRGETLHGAAALPFTPRKSA